MKTILPYPGQILVWLAVRTIKAYQKTLSPDHGFFKLRHPYGFCRYYPSCSQYAIDALNKYGIIKGGFKSAWRVLRCNPFSRGGEDQA